jgi:hypothetical protein
MAILNELGSRAEVPLAHLWELLTKQPHGESDIHGAKGILLFDGSTNVFYVRGIDDRLWAIGLQWKSFYDGWNIMSWPWEREFPNSTGDRIFSR